MSHYDPIAIEPKWQKYWAAKDLFRQREEPSKPKYYLLEMLPYPSGRIHMGHVRNYSIGDVAARFKRMQGFSVLHPMGWDAFGMPAENAAIKHGVPPGKWTRENISTMRTQLKRLGFFYDWEREFATSDSDYYRWEQFLFLKMVEKGLCFQKYSSVNWCVKCKTVLANEQVVAGLCWRCDSAVTQKMLKQWYFKITAYAEELLRDIDEKLQGWPDRVKIMQKEWIGKSVGATIDFPVEGLAEKIEIFTTRPDTLFGVTFMSLACEHPLVMPLAQKGGRKKEVEVFVEKTGKLERLKRLMGDYEKEGAFTGCYCLHPLTGEKLPIYAANFVLMDYGTGAVMAVPGHDQRDFEFARKHDLPVKIVIQPEGEKLDAAKMKEAYVAEGILVDSEKFNGMKSQTAIAAITQYLEKKGLGKQGVTYRLKDWCLSRQRYWGAPIPIIYCDGCGTVNVPEKDLPVELPENIAITGEGGSPLAKHKAFVETKCPRCKGKAKRETDTMDTFVESSWYFFRYVSPKFSKGPFDPAAVKHWFPIDQYIGGIEHAVGHLIYCRFFTKVLRDLGFLKFDEPVKNLLTQGMVCLGGSAMSKSRGNVVDPDLIIEKYGADTARLFILFAAPPEKDLEWNEQGVEGMYRFLGRVWRLITSNVQRPTSKNQEKEMWKHKTIKRVTEDIEKFHFNTALAALMEYLNFLQGQEAPTKEEIETFVILLSPFAPHLCEELWEHLGHQPSIMDTPWPAFDAKALQSDVMIIVVQVNGKLRGTLEVAVSENEETIKSQAQGLDRVQPHLVGKQIAKIIYVPKKLVNIVVP